MERADLVFYNGLHLEGQMGRAFAELGPKAVALSDGIDPTRLRQVEGITGGYDPHIWFDTQLWMIAVTPVRDRLATLDPGHADNYADNAAEYLKELAELDGYVKSQAARLPQDRRVLVTAHDAFGYFGRAYGFEVFGLQGVSTEAEASVADVQRLADFIVMRRVPVVFVETSVNPKNLAAVRQAVRAKGADVRVLSGADDQLGSDALGSPGTPTGTYAGLVRHNIDLMLRALGPSHE
jgi:manganese/zinc/iron transport system substrate-binding protein